MRQWVLATGAWAACTLTLMHPDSQSTAAGALAIAYRMTTNFGCQETLLCCKQLALTSQALPRARQEV